jgi:dihydroorotase
MSTYDLLIRGGTVIDPAARIHDRRDVAISGGKVAAVEPDLGATEAARAVDASGKLVLPGLIDLHAHIFKGYGDGCDPATACLARGTTTVVDGGTVGWRAYAAFREFVVKPSPARIFTLLNISAVGLIDTRVGELSSFLHVDPDGAVRAADANRDNVLGFKIRLSGYVAGGTFKPALRLTRQAADETGLRIMAHIGETTEPLPEALELFKPGDVITHTYTGRRHGILDYNGKLLPAVREARERGVHFDAAHGRMHFGFDLIRRAMDQGFLPDTLSTDITVPTAVDPTFHLPHLMSKLMALGASLDDVVLMTTSNSARWLGLESEIGTLQPGAGADVAILEQLEGQFTFRDNEGQTIQAERRLRPWLTVRAGQVVEAPADA